MSDELLDFMEADTQSDASTVEAVSDGGLQSVGDLARAVREKEELVLKLEEQLKEEKKHYLNSPMKTYQRFCLNLVLPNLSWRTDQKLKSDPPMAHTSKQITSFRLTNGSVTMSTVT